MKAKTILVVDDDPLSIRAISQILLNRPENGGFEIVNANNGATAAKLADSIVPDLIVSDWQMPEMSGIELLATLKKNNSTKEIPVIIASGIMLSSNDLDIALEAGAVDYIRKPIDGVELVARIRSVLEMSDHIKTLKAKDYVIVDQEKELLRKNVSKLQQNLEYKQRELAVNISFLTQLEKEKEQYLGDLSRLSPYLSAEGKTHLNAIRQETKKNVANKSLLQLEASFDEINHHFYEALDRMARNITKTEKLLCAYTRMNLSPSEIASIMRKNLNAINVSFSRIRTKLDVQSNLELKEFLFAL